MPVDRPARRRVGNAEWTYVTACMDVGGFTVGDANDVAKILDDVHAVLAAADAPSWPEVDQLAVWVHPADPHALLLVVTFPHGLRLTERMRDADFHTAALPAGEQMARHVLERLLDKRAQLERTLAGYVAAAFHVRDVPIGELAARCPHRPGMPLAALPWTCSAHMRTRALDRLEAAGAHTVGDLRTWTDERLARLPGFGRGCVRALKVTLAAPSPAGHAADARR